MEEDAVGEMGGDRGGISWGLDRSTEGGVSSVGCTDGRIASFIAAWGSMGRLSSSGLWE